MTWEIAFTIVGCLWALVVLYSIRSERTRELEKDISYCKEQLQLHRKDIDWLLHCIRKESK